MMAFLLFKPEPARRPDGGPRRWIARQVHLSSAAADAPSSDRSEPARSRVAREYFAVPTDDDRLKIVVADGAAYLQDNLSWPADVIVVDGYDAESQVEALSTPAFYRELRAGAR